MSATVRPAEGLADLDRQTIVHPFLPSTIGERVIMVEGDGCRIRDHEGREYLDATGGLWLAQVGHGRRELAEAAARQMQRLEYFMSFWEFSNEQAPELAARLVRLSPESLSHVHFVSGGSEGNDTAIKMARLHHHLRGDTERTWILSRRLGYHGLCYGSGTATGFELFHEGFGPMLPHVRHLTPPWPYHHELYKGDDPTEFCVRELEQAIEEIGSQRIAAFIGEPVMGVAGMVVPPEDYWARIQELLHSHGILLIVDEVVTAYGRTGDWFAAPRFGLEPDIAVTAKGITSGYIPLGAVLVSDAVAESLVGGLHGFPMGLTYNGHATACAVALANLDIMEKEDLLGAATRTGAFLLGELEQLTELPIVGEVRGLGMMLAVELVADKEARTPLSVADDPIENVIRRDHGVIVRATVNDVGHSLVLSPPLVMSEEEARAVAAAIGTVLARTGIDGQIA